MTKQPTRESTDITASLAGPQIHEIWKQAFITPEIERIDEHLFDEVLQQIGAPPGAQFLDIGCGSARNAARLAKRGYRVIGTDFSPSALQNAAQLLAAQNLQDVVKLQREDLLSLSFTDGQYPYVLCCAVLMHIAEVERALSELARVVAPGGFLVIVENNAGSLQERIRRVFNIHVPPNSRRKECGYEDWMESPSGRWLARIQDIDWMTGILAARGLVLKYRRAREFTEAYSIVHSPTVRRLIHQWNYLWFRYVRKPALSFQNVLVFEKV